MPERESEIDTQEQDSGRLSEEEARGEAEKIISHAKTLFEKRISKEDYTRGDAFNDAYNTIEARLVNELGRAGNDMKKHSAALKKYDEAEDLLEDLELALQPGPRSRTNLSDKIKAEKQEGQ